MNDKIQIALGRDVEFQELPTVVTRILLPNGDEYTIRYDPLLQGIVLNKAYSDNEQHITIIPRVSNEVLIK